MYKVIYLGYSEKMLQALHESQTFEVVLVIGTKGRLSKKYYDLINQYNMRFIEIKNKKELLDNIFLLENADLTIMYKFEFIIPNEIAEKHLIINFHGGELHKNRGAHAVVWSILLQESNTCLSCYRLSGGIDEGLLIDAYYVDINKNDNVSRLNEKLAEGIPKMLSSIEGYLLGVKKPELITGGKYRRKIKKSDYTIDLSNDAIDLMRAKILSQQAFDGAVIIINKKEYRIKKFEIFEDGLKRDLQVEICERWVDVYRNGKGIRLFLENDITILKTE